MYALASSKPSVDACCISLYASCYTPQNLSFLICKVRMLYLGTRKLPFRPGILGFCNSVAEGLGLSCQAFREANPLKLSVRRSHSREQKKRWTFTDSWFLVKPVLPISYFIQSPHHRRCHLSCTQEEAETPHSPRGWSRQDLNVGLPDPQPCAFLYAALPLPTCRRPQLVFHLGWGWGMEGRGTT